jgi:hypothetical protein
MLVVSVWINHAQMACGPPLILVRRINEQKTETREDL